MNRISRTGSAVKTGVFAGVIVICIPRITASVNHLRRVASKRTAVKPVAFSRSEFLGSAMLAREESAWRNTNYTRLICDALRNQEHSRVRTLTLRSARMVSHVLSKASAVRPSRAMKTRAP